MPRKETRSGPSKPQRTRNVQPVHHDTYVSRKKEPDAMVCDGCGVVRHGGRWFWGAPPSGEVRGGLCPACRRTRDRYPAGTLSLPGGLGADFGELRRLIRGVEEAEREEHPLERIMAIEESGDTLVVTTTGHHIARRIASRLRQRLHRKPKVRYGTESAVRIDWEQEEELEA